MSVVAVLPTSEDPAYQFMDATPVAALDITSNSNQEQLYRVAFSANFGAMVSLVIVGEQAGGANAKVNAAISVALSLKS